MIDSKMTKSETQESFVGRKMGTPSIDGYLAENGLSWCREERQIALFFYNVLLDIKNKKEGGIPETIRDEICSVFDTDSMRNIEIVHVFYEAAILRDYYHDLDDIGRKEFNVDLLEYCLTRGSDNDEYKKKLREWSGDLLTKYYDGEKAKLLNPKGRIKPAELIEMNDNTVKDKETDITKQRIHFAGMIMNAKPDIMVVYRDVNTKKKYAVTLECKFESKPGYYKDHYGSRTINQELLQEMIMTFLRRKYDFGK